MLNALSAVTDKFNVAAPAAEFAVIPATKIAAVSTDLRMNQPLWNNTTSQFSVNPTVGVNTPPSFINTAFSAQIARFQVVTLGIRDQLARPSLCAFSRPFIDCFARQASILLPSPRAATRLMHRAPIR